MWRIVDRRPDARFGDYIVQGFKYQSENGEFGWHTTSWPGENPIHDFWVSGQELYHVTMHYLYRGTNENRMELRGLAEGVSPAEKRAVLDAISFWESTEPLSHFNK
jgi:hypothetical protein